MSCGFACICWRNSLWKTSFLVQCSRLMSSSSSNLLSSLSLNYFEFFLSPHYEYLIPCQETNHKYCSNFFLSCLLFILLIFYASKKKREWQVYRYKWYRYLLFQFFFFYFFWKKGINLGLRHLQFFLRY